jgi:hypothetical protein
MKRKWLGGPCVATVWLSLCSVAHAQEKPRANLPAAAATQQSRPVVRRDRNAAARWALIGAGAAVLATTYAWPCGAAGGRWCVPIAGPFLVIAKLDKQERQNTSSEDGIIPPVFVYTLIGGVGLLQILGTSAIVVGALLPRREVTTSARTLTVAPLLGPSVVGVGAVGTF